MALDLSGFTIPEQKFEGLYKLGEELSSQRKAEAAAKTAEAKAAKDAADKLQANEDLNTKLLYESLDPNKWLTGDPTDEEMLFDIQKIKNSGTKFLSENKGASSSQLRQFMYNPISQLAQKQILIKKVDENIKDQLGKLNPNIYNVNEATKKMKEKFFYKEDADGNLVKKQMNEIQIDPAAYDEVFKKYGYELVNAKGVLNVINKLPKTQTTTQVGNTTTTVSLSPWQQVTKDGKIVPKLEPATEMDENNQPIELKDDKGNIINVVPDETYSTIIAYAPETDDYLNSQLNLVSSELGREVDPDSQEGMLYKKKLLTELITQTGGGRFSQTTKRYAPRRSGGISYSQKKDLDAQSALTKSVQARDEDATGYIDITDKFGGYKYGKRRFGKDGVLYNPATQEFKLKLIDEDGNVTEEVKTFDDVTSTIYASNPEKNIDVLEGLKKVASKKSDDDISMYDPATQAGIKSYSNAKKISISEAKKKLKAAGKIK